MGFDAGTAGLVSACRLQRSGRAPPPEKGRVIGVRHGKLAAIRPGACFLSVLIFPLGSDRCGHRRLCLFFAAGRHCCKAGLIVAVSTSEVAREAPVAAIAVYRAPCWARLRPPEPFYFDNGCSRRLLMKPRVTWGPGFGDLLPRFGSTPTNNGSCRDLAGRASFHCYLLGLDDSWE